MLALATLALASTRGARADGAITRATAVHARSEVLFGVIGPIDDVVRGELRRLLEAELRAAGLTLIERDPPGAAAQWAEEAAHGQRTLLVVLLDARDDTGWRLVVIDAARSRAIARQLPGGIEQNAASVEAVVSIVSSASSALVEGLEVASSPVDSVLGSPTKEQPVRAIQAPPSRDAPAPKSALRERRTSLLFAAGPSVATLSSAASVTAGASVVLGASIRDVVEVRGTFAYHWPVTVASELGEFELDRRFAALSAGPSLLSGPFGLTPEAGVCVEWLRRDEADARPGANGSEARTHARWGGLLTLRGRYRFTRALSLEAVAGAAYFGQAVHFVVENASRDRISDVGRTTFHGQLGLQIALP